MHAFKQHVLSLLSPHTRVLELGAGKCGFARAAEAYGAVVTAVDQHTPMQPCTRFLHLTVEEWMHLQPEQYDLICSFNLIQFLDKSWVLNTLLPHCITQLAPNGRLAIQTFTAPPIPPFEIMSAYTAEDFLQLGLRVEHISTTSETCEGLDGTIRTFHLCNFIGIKPAVPEQLQQSQQSLHVAWRVPEVPAPTYAHKTVLAPPQTNPLQDQSQ